MSDSPKTVRSVPCWMRLSDGTLQGQQDHSSPRNPQPCLHQTKLTLQLSQSSATYSAAPASEHRYTAAEQAGRLRL